MHRIDWPPTDRLAYRDRECPCIDADGRGREVADPVWSWRSAGRYARPDLGVSARSRATSRPRRRTSGHTVDVTDKQLVRQPERVYAQAIIDLTDVQHLMTTPRDIPVEKAEAAAIGFGWWVRIVRTADAVRRLHEAGLSNEASPLVRTILLHWVALAWLCQHPDEAVEGANFENKRWKQRFVNTAAGSRWKLKKVKLGPPPPKDCPVGWYLLNDIEALCKRAGTPDTYLPYTLESPYSHPSLISAWSYVRTVAGDEEAHDTAPVPGVSLRVVANAAALATKLFGEFIEDPAMVARAEAVAAAAHLPLAFGDSAPAPVEPDGC